MDLTELTVTLAGLAGPSGFEGPVGEYAAAWLAPFADEVKRDVLGNVMAFKRCGAAGAKTRSALWSPARRTASSPSTRWEAWICGCCPPGR